MTRPETYTPEGFDPSYRSPRETCTHEHTVTRTMDICAIKRSTTICVQCGLAVA